MSSELFKIMSELIIPHIREQVARSAFSRSSTYTNGFPKISAAVRSVCINVTSLNILDKYSISSDELTEIICKPSLRQELIALSCFSIPLGAMLVATVIVSSLLKNHTYVQFPAAYNRLDF